MGRGMGPSPYRFGCSHCSNDFATADELTQHTLNVHPRKASYPYRKVKV